MLTFGVICPPLPGHINPLAALGRTLCRRGHRVTVFHVPDLEKQILKEDLSFVSLGVDQYSPGTLHEALDRMRQLKGIASLRFAVQSACRLAKVILEHGPKAMKENNVDVVLADQNEPAAGSVAEHLGLPFISICTSLPLNREPKVPPPFVSWPYADSRMSECRNRIGYAVADRLIAPIQAIINRYRTAWKLPSITAPDDSFSPLAQIAQMPREFDFPREQLPSNFHYLGPWFDDHDIAPPFPFDRLDGRPVIYGSLGTLQDSRHAYFQTMAEACATLDVQLVISVGRGGGTHLSGLAGNPIVVDYAPQPALLSRAAATITHAGMNTTQQSLYFGVPLIAIPLTHDQPAIAARIARTGAGLVIPPTELNSSKLREALSAVLPQTSSYRRHAQKLSHACRQAGGSERAADICEQAAAQNPQLKRRSARMGK